MASIVIVEPHCLLRLGMVGLVACVAAPHLIRCQSYDELFRSPPANTQAELVVLGAPPEERIHLLIQAVRRAYSPKRIVLMSHPPTLPATWANIPSVVVGYVSSSSSAESILASLQPWINNTRTTSRATSTGHRPDLAVSPPHSPAPTPQPSAHPLPVTAHAAQLFNLEVDEAKMLGLSPRQYEVLLLLAQGYPIKLISRQLNISLATTKGHLEALYQRLGVHNRNEAVFAALARGATLSLPSPATTTT